MTLTPDQWARIPEVFEHVLGLGFLEVGIAPASPVSAELLPTPEQDEALFAGFALLAERFAREAAQGRVLPFSNLLDLLARLHLGQVKGAPCGAGLGYLAMDAEGRFFLCHRFAGIEQFRVGDLDSGVDHAKIRRVPRRAGGAARATRAARAGRAASAPAAATTRTTCARSELGLPPGGSCDFIRRWLELGIRVYAGLARDPDNPVLAFLGRRADG